MERLEIAGHELLALSVGGLETCHYFPRLKLAFDIGRCPEEVVNCATVLFTHAHMDHMGGVAYHTATRALRNLAPPRYVIPPHCVDDFERLFEVWRGLDRSDMRHETVVLAPGEELVLENGLCVRPFRAPHSAPCQGYGIWSRREKLLEEFSGLSGEEIARLKRAGTSVTRTLETPEVAFCGDTLIEVVEREEVVRRARLLLLECTFVDGEVDVEQARSKGHVHLLEIAARAAL
ncbi:MAG: MBL fold metallo-hydrolase, partial [Planctomycetota bacterium]